jgi:dolichol-phosphate mannosyltransferase
LYDTIAFCFLHDHPPLEPSNNSSTLSDTATHPPEATVPAKPLVIVPTYMEAANISPLVKQIMQLPTGFDVLVIDDNSPDRTAQIVRDLQSNYRGRIKLIERPGKQGLGTAYIRGFKYALLHDYTHICEMDADFSHNPDDLTTLVNAVGGKADKADVAIGSRYVDGVRVVNWPLSRLILSYSASFYTRVITGLPITDVTAGFKCYHRRVLEAIDLEKVNSNGYSFQIEMKYRAWRKGFTLVEVPIIFTERTEGESKMSKRIVWEAAWKVWELRLRSIIGRL